LLADDGAGRFVVDVEVAGGVGQGLRCVVDDVAVGRKHGTGQCVRAGGVHEVEGFLPAVVFEDVDGEHGAKDFFLHGGGVGVFGYEPDTGRNVSPARRRTLLPLEFKGTAQHSDGYLLGIGVRMGDDEIFTTGLTHHAGVGAVLADVHPDFLPQVLEHTGATGEVKPGEVAVLENDISHFGAVGVDQVDDAGGQACFFEKLHDHYGAVDLGFSRLPDHGVATHCRCGREVGGDAGEVERRGGEDETFQGAVLQLIPDRSGADERLFAVNFLKEVSVEAEEVTHFGHRVNFRLVSVFALGKHRGGVHPGTVRAGEEVRSPQENGGAFVPGGVRPALFCGKGGVNRLVHVLLGTAVKMTEKVLVLVWWVDAYFFTFQHPFAVDESGKLIRLGFGGSWRMIYP